jgi:hypothetical protein
VERGAAGARNASSSSQKRAAARDHELGRDRERRRQTCAIVGEFERRASLPETRTAVNAKRRFR